MGKIITVCGEITPQELGYTSMHDHTIYDFDGMQKEIMMCIPDTIRSYFAYQKGADIRAEAKRRKKLKIEVPSMDMKGLLSYMKLPDRNPAKALSDVEYYINELKLFHQLGGQSLCDDSTVCFFKPRLKAIQEISRQSGIHIISCAGFYTSVTIPNEYAKKGEGYMQEYVERIITQGDGTCDARPGFVKCAVHTLRNGELAPKEMLAVRACARAAKIHGMSLHIHTNALVRNSVILKVADMLEYEFGLEPDRVVFCHMDAFSIGLLSQTAKLNTDGYSTELPTELARRGFNVGIDTWSTTSDDKKIYDYSVNVRKKLLADMIDLGFAENITLGHDMMRKTAGTQNYGGGYTVFSRALQEMVQTGELTSEQVQTITIKNPARILQIAE